MIKTFRRQRFGLSSARSAIASGAPGHNPNSQSNGSFIKKRLVASALLASSLLLTATAEATHRKMMQMEVVKSQQVTMEHGSKAIVHVVKMNGHLMVVIPRERIPDPLYQQLFRHPCTQDYGTGYCD